MHASMISQPKPLVFSYRQYGVQTIVCIALSALLLLVPRLVGWVDLDHPATTNPTMLLTFLLLITLAIFTVFVLLRRFFCRKGYAYMALDSLRLDLSDHVRAYPYDRITKLVYYKHLFGGGMFLCCGSNWIFIQRVRGDESLKAVFDAFHERWQDWVHALSVILPEEKAKGR